MSTHEEDFNDAKRHIAENLDRIIHLLQRHHNGDVDGIEADDLRGHPDSSMAVTISYLVTVDGVTSTCESLYDQCGDLLFPEQYQKTCWDESKIIYPEGEAQ
jgi:hypothetical protein